MGRDSIFPSVQEGHFVKVESGERHEAHQKHEGHKRKFAPLLVSSVASTLLDRKNKVFFFKMVCSSYINKCKFN
jgi:hypothetical protein